jgi:hypothetical protein
LQDSAVTLYLLLRLIKQCRHQQPRLSVNRPFTQITRQFFLRAKTVAGLGLLPDKVERVHHSLHKHLLNSSDFHIRNSYTLKTAETAYAISAVRRLK